MNNSLFDRIWAAQEKLAADPQYAGLLEEYHIKNTVLLENLETMTDSHRHAVMDFLGVLAELYLKMLVYSIDNRS